MRTTIVASICLAVAIPALKADLIVKEKVEGGFFPTPQEVTVKVEGTKCRADETGQKVTTIDSATGTTPSQRSTIIDTATGTMTILLHPRKAYVKISLEQVGKQAEALKILAGNKGRDATQAEFQPIGKKKTIDGYKTEEYTASVNGVPATVAIAKNFPNYQEVLRALFNVKSGPGLDAYSRLSVPPQKISRDANPDSSQLQGTQDYDYP
jgi:hypothetical protein